jgi:type IV pilus assembly protein PilW
MKLKKFSQSGVSLIELMVSITIGLVILAAILAVFSATTSTSRQSESTSRMSEDAAVSMNYMTGYIRMAGFSFPQITALGGVTDSNFAGSGVRGCDNGFSNPTVSATTSLTCNASGGSAAIAIRFEGDVNNTTPAAGNPTDCLNQAVTASTTSAFNGAPAFRLIESRFFVATGTNSGVAELYCAGNGGAGAFVAQPIMQYVERMVLTYGIAQDVTSRQVSQYVSAAAIDALAGNVDQRWSRVISVRICFVMRSEQISQAQGSTPYRDCSGASVTPTDNLIRRTFQSVVTLRNRGGVS